MTFTNGEIFISLHACGITPSKTSFKSSVVEFFEDNLDNPKCQIIIDWIEKTSLEFNDYASRVWRLANRTFKSVEPKNPEWWHKGLEVPDVSNCSNVGCGCKPAPVEDMDEDVEVIFAFFLNIC